MDLLRPCKNDDDGFHDFFILPDFKIPRLFQASRSVTLTYASVNVPVLIFVIYITDRKATTYSNPT